MYFSYPLDSNFIVRKKKNIKKDLLSKTEKQDNILHINIAILGGSTIGEIKDILELFLLDKGIQPRFYESEYNKFYEDSLFGNDKLDSFKPDIIYLHTSVKNLRITPPPPSINTQEEFDSAINAEINKYKSIWESLTKKFNCPIIQNNFEYLPYRILGNLDSYHIQGKTHFISTLNLKFAELAKTIPNLYLQDINYLSSLMGLDLWFDDSLYCQAKYAMSMEVIPHLAFNLTSIISSIFGKNKKCLVLDLDNTCWGGVIGDDGLELISIGDESALGEAYTIFQVYIKELKERGIILAVCSKNEESNAKLGFTHPRSTLAYDDFSAFRANWNPKDDNIKDIAKEINIGLDSIVFIDDNPVERDIVSNNIPEVFVPNIGNNVLDFIKHIDRNACFELINLSNEDLQRNKYYEDNKKRLQEEFKYKTYDEFLQSLAMKAEIKAFSSIYLDRITQLINKTNQFNCTTRRYTFNEVQDISTNKDYITLYGKLTDKYGDNGLIAITIGRIDGVYCHIDLWLMSCRVLKRNMEYAMLDSFIKIAKQRGILILKGYFYKTNKNSMVANLYGDFGFKLIDSKDDNSVWELDIKDYKVKTLHIGVEND